MDRDTMSGHLKTLIEALPGDAFSPEVQAAFDNVRNGLEEEFTGGNPEFINRRNEYLETYFGPRETSIDGGAEPAPEAGGVPQSAVDNAADGVIDQGQDEPLNVESDGKKDDEDFTIPINT